MILVMMFPIEGELHTWLIDVHGVFVCEKIRENLGFNPLYSYFHQVTFMKDGVPVMSNWYSFRIKYKYNFKIIIVEMVVRPHEFQ